jgi:hypothetical protein
MQIDAGEVRAELKRIDSSAVVKGEVLFPLHPSQRRSLVAVRTISHEGKGNETNTIYLFWKSSDGAIHHLTLATSVTRRCKLFVSAFNVLAPSGCGRDNEVLVSILKTYIPGPPSETMHGSAMIEFIGTLAEGATKFEKRYPKGIIRR